jgi:thiol-disulfide isomerase/thioredoxin
MIAPLLLATTMSFADPAGAKVTLDEPGMLYLVDFWAEGCKGCIEEMPELERLARELERTGRFRLISVLWGGWRGAELNKFAERYGMGRPLHSDPDGWLEKLGKPALPTKVLVRDGEILKHHVGGGAGAYRYWKPIVEKALAPASP